MLSGAGRKWSPLCREDLPPAPFQGTGREGAKLNGGLMFGDSGVTGTTKGNLCGGGHLQKPHSPAMWGR